MKPCVPATVTTALLALASTSSGYVVLTRWVERVGNLDVVIPGNLTELANGAPHRFRLQMGVFDDASGPAPSGGFVGWNVGTLSVSGPTNNSTERRTPGRLAPFTFSTGQGANGNPPVPAGGDVDFQTLTDIDATLGTQTPTWLCDANGQPLPQPNPTIRGRNTFVSVYEITSQAPTFYSSYTITAGGNAIAALEWRAVGTPVPPDCTDPSNPVPGAVTYAPFADAPRAFTSQLTIVSPPTPGAATAFVISGFLLNYRRRGR